jgi:acetyl-CoA carboxylase carboxyltransferase component
MTDDPIRPELAALRTRTDATLDASRPNAVAKRRATNQRTARENVADLADPGSFDEYGGLALAAQRARLPIDKLIEASPADGLVAGIASIGGTRTLVLAYDYTVFAGTQGGMSHKKLDRMLGLAQQWRLPVVLFAEGGGGRPNDTDMPLVAGLDTPSFFAFAALGGLAPRIGIVSGRCFAGNAALLGCCDVIIATDNSSIGMGGPAMIEGGGLGTFTPEQVGPIDMQTTCAWPTRPKVWRSRRSISPTSPARHRRGPAPIRRRSASSFPSNAGARSRCGRSSTRSPIPAACSSFARTSAPRW